MHYTGGKARIGKRIAAYLESQRKPGQPYVEPFVGAANVIIHMSGERQAFDAHSDLILLWRAILRGWKPPLAVSEQEYKSFRCGRPSALRGFVGFGCAFGGAFFGGYARSKDRTNYAAAAARSLAKKAASLRDVPFRRRDYAELQVSGALIYCDPPYAGTADFRGVPKFDHAAFWQTMRDWSQSNTVLVSEVSAPADFAPVLTIEAPTGYVNKSGLRPPRTEHLFRLN